MTRFKLADTLEELMRIHSPTGEEGALGLYLEALVQRLGFSVTRQEVGPSRFNLWTEMEESPELLFCTHMDTVLPEVPFRREGDRIFGRGACDAKGPLAAMLEASLRLREEGLTRIGHLFVVGEERDSDGARAAAAAKTGARFIVLGEPTENRLVSGQKGTLVFRLIFHGEAGHSAYPGHGRSAVHALVERMGRWLNREWGSTERFGETTLNLGKLSGGTGANVIAERAEVDGIFRVTTPLDRLLEQISEMAAADEELQILSKAEPIQLFVPEGYEAEVVSFGSDAPHLRPLAPVLMCGPGSIRYAHRPDEQIGLGEVEEGVERYIRLARDLLAGGDGGERC